jgi:hypothetical protein
MQNLLTLRQQIRAKIAETRKKETGDYESLIRQVDNEHRKINLNLPQAVANTSQALIKVLEWGRGTGKTTYWGAHLNSILREMPRSSGVIPSATYKDMLTHIIPSLIQGLELFGLYEGLHYFIGEKPPRAWRNSWGTAYQPPKRNDHYITFWNGTGAHLLSQDIKGDGRGLNADWSAADEAAKLDGQRLQEEVEPTLRGTNVAAFKKSRLFGSRLFSTSVALTQEGTWYQKYEDLAAYDPKKYTFIKATSEYNRENLREGFLEEAESIAYSAWVFNAEYKNIRPNMVKNGFYALLDLNRHAYNAYNYNFLNKVGQDTTCQIDEDLVKGVPLIISMDFGAVINSLTVNQHLKSINEYRTLKSFFVLGDDKKIQDDLINDFHKYYQSHQATNPDIFFWYDNSGNVRTGITRITRAEQVRDQLQKLGWKPRLMTTGGSNPQHESKYLLWLQILGEKDPRYPKYRINKGNCRELWISMSHAKIKRSSTGLIQKDKSVEKSTRIQRQEATDLSDANDTAIFGMFSHLNNGFGGYLPDFAVTMQ